MILLLDCDALEVEEVKSTGGREFGGGFGRGTFGSWSEQPTKAFVGEAVDESLELEAALAQHQTASKIVAYHSPIRETVEGAPAEILPYSDQTRRRDAIGRGRRAT